MDISIDGIVPVMLTPFLESDSVDDAGYARLIEWYLAHGADALFAVCQSSEMQRLTLGERVHLARRAVEVTAGRVPVIASGHISDTLDDQITELTAMAETGIQALVLVTNRLDPSNQGFAAFRAALDAILARLPTDLALGLYECPAPFRRLLGDDEIKLCRDTGRFVVLKDVSCDLATIRRRVALTEGTNFAIVNANAAVAVDAMRAGARGFGGVFNNVHPDLYAWIYRNLSDTGEMAKSLTTFLALSAMAEGMGYPKLAKLYHTRLGTFASAHTRAVDYDPFERHWASSVLLDHIHDGTRHFRAAIAALRTG